MTNSDWVQLIGTAAIVLLAAVFVWIANDTGRFSRYGREALLAAAAYLLTAAAVRILALTGYLTQVQARELNGIFAWVFLIIGAETLLLQRVERHYDDQHPPGKEQ